MPLLTFIFLALILHLKYFAVKEPIYAHKTSLLYL